MDCTKCGRKNIKYLCIFRKTPICNVCSVACSDKTPGYSEENFLVGKCNEDSCESSRTTQKPSGFSAAKPKPRQSDRQTTLLGFFNKTPVSISDRSKTDFDRAKIKLTGHFDRRPISRYIEPWNTSPMLCQLSYAVSTVRVSDISEQNLVPSIPM